MEADRLVTTGTKRNFVTTAVVVSDRGKTAAHALDSVYRFTTADQT